MNRRNFIRGLTAAVAGFSILPPATTYNRIWKAAKRLRVNPEWVTAPYRAVVMWSELVMFRPYPSAERIGDGNEPRGLGYTLYPVSKCVETSRRFAYNEVTGLYEELTALRS